MTDQIVLTVPEDISAVAREIAETTARPVEKVLLDQLKTLALPLDVQDELDALQHLSDDTLWTIAREQMPEEIQARAHELMDKNSRGTISDEEHAELEKLVERGDRLMLRKAEAAVLLKKRGYPFSQQDFKPKHVSS
jgi:hypothetical protein